MNENKSSSMEDFEKQLRHNMNVGSGEKKTMEEFEKQLKQTINPSVTPMQSQGVQPQPNNKQTIKVKKNIVLSFPLKLVA